MAAHITFAVDVLGRLGQVWREASVEARDLQVGSMFPDGLVIEGGKCRTPVESELISLFPEKKQKKTKDADPREGTGVSGLVAGAGFEPATFGL